MPPRANLSFAGLDSSTFKSKESYSEDEIVFESKELKKTVKPSLEKIEFVNARNTTVKNENKAEKPRKFSQSPRAVVLTKSKQVQVNTAKQSSYRVATSVSIARHVNTAVSRSHVNDALPTTYSYFKEHSPVRSPFNQKSPAKTNNFNEKINTAKFNNVTTARTKAVVSAAEGNRNNAEQVLLSDYHEIDGGFVAFGENAKGVSHKCVTRKTMFFFSNTGCVVLSPDFKLLDESQVLLKVPRNKNMYSFDLKNVVPVGAVFLTKSKQVPVNTAKQSSYRVATSVSIARHVNTDVSRSHVNDALQPTYSYFKEHSPVRSLFNQKSPAKTNNFNEKINTAKVNNVTTARTKAVVSTAEGNRNNALLDESQVLLKVPRNKNMYSFDLKNVVPVGGLTCLFTKATLDESKLWHRRLGHINFKTMNKLVRGNLVRGLPLKHFENDHTCVACQKRKQHKASCIRREFSVDRTSQQNGVIERKNMKLIEAVGTMLADSKLPTTFSTEAVHTACYVQNRVLVIKPHNKTPYELFL
nr:ribonuclease H-like domain-containing protein [Tanacetum cinerariifolium]